MEAHKLLLVLRLVVQRHLHEVSAGHDAFGVFGTIFTELEFENANLFRESGPDKSKRMVPAGGAVVLMRPPSARI